MVETLIKERMQMIGLTQAKLAEAVGCTPTQMGLFLKSEASLNREALDKCLKVVGINLEVYQKRAEIARKVAEKLSNIPMQEIAVMDPQSMARASEINSILLLPNPTEAEFEKIIETGIMDYEDTFPYFKALVLHFNNIKNTNVTPKTVQMSFERLAKGLALVPAAAMIGGFFMPSLIGVAIGTLVSSRVYSKAAQNAMAPMLSITRKLLKSKDNA